MIRSLFVDPCFARRGLATKLVAQCLNDARNHGFDRIETLASAVSQPVFSAAGFDTLTQVMLRFDDGVELESYHMAKSVPA